MKRRLAKPKWNTSLKQDRTVCRAQPFMLSSNFHPMSFQERKHKMFMMSSAADPGSTVYVQEPMAKVL